MKPSMKRYARSIATLFALIAATSLSAQQPSRRGDRVAKENDWSELTAGIEKMHVAMGSIQPSGNSDADFVKLMLPHHEAALEMSRAELLHGKDPQIRSLAQEITADQQSELVATIPVGNLPHGIWPSGDGSRVYVALENGEMAVAIDTVSNKVIANIPIGQTTQALVYVPNAVPSGDGTGNLSPLGEAGNTARLHLEAAGTALPKAQASVALNSLGLLDLVQIATEGLAPKSQYQVYLAESDHTPFGKLIPLAVVKTNPDGGGIVQAIGPLKALVSGDSSTSASPRRYLIVTDLKDQSKVVLRQAE